MSAGSGPPTTDLRAIGSAFEIAGTYESGEPYGSGHIHDTYLVEYRTGSARARFLHQKINERVFRDPSGMMENIARVLAHLRRKGAEAGVRDLSRRVPALVPARAGTTWALDEHGGFWRTWVFIEGSTSVDVVDGPQRAREAARAFGTFQRDLLDLPGPRLHETIPGFHDTRARVRALRLALEADPRNRARSVEREVEFALAHEHLAGALLDLREQGLLDERVVHNDSKLGNLLFDEGSGEALAVVDLDTVMPGLSLYDFGDLVRTVSSRGGEDDPEGTRVEPELFAALARGYLESLSGVVNALERESLVLAGKVIAYECGLRFLTDHLEGERYFRIHREGQNRDRCRAQFALVRSLESSEDELRSLVGGP